MPETYKGYTYRSRIEAVIPRPMLIDALDDDRDQQEDPGVFDSVVFSASKQIDGFLAGRFTVPFPKPLPPVVEEAAFIFTCELIYLRREFIGDKNPFTKRADDMRTLLKQIAKQEAPLDASLTPAITAGAAVTEPNTLDASLR